MSLGSWRTAPRLVLQASSPWAARPSASSGLRIASVPGRRASQDGRQRRKAAPPLRTRAKGRGWKTPPPPRSAPGPAAAPPAGALRAAPRCPPASDPGAPPVARRLPAGRPRPASGRSWPGWPAVPGAVACRQSRADQGTTATSAAPVPAAEDATAGPPAASHGRRPAGANQSWRRRRSGQSLGGVPTLPQSGLHPSGSSERVAPTPCPRPCR